MLYNLPYNIADLKKKKFIRLLKIALLSKLDSIKVACRVRVAYLKE